MSQMRGAVLRQLNKPLSIENLEVPNISDGQVLVKLAYSGVCHSQIMEMEGKRGIDKWVPHLLGHEGSGYVEVTGPYTSKVKVGDRVGISWLKSCGKDAATPVYRSHNFSDSVNSGKSTTFSEYTIVPENRVFKVPENISTLEAVLFGCAIPTGAGMVLNEHEPGFAENILVYGLGGIGLSALITIISLGFKNISVADISLQKLKIAKNLGVSKLYNLSEPMDRDDISARKFDSIYEAAGTIEGIEMSFSMLKDTGTLVFASHPEAGKKISLDPHELIKGKTIKGSWGGGSDPETVVQKFSEIRKSRGLDLNAFIGNIYSLDQINQALLDLKSGKVLRPIIKL